MDRQFRKLDIWARPNPDTDQGFEFLLAEPSHSYYLNEDDVRVGTTSVSFDPPADMSHEQMVLKAIETLRDKQKQIQASAQRRVAVLEEKINGYLLLTHQPEASNVVEIIPAEEPEINIAF